MLQISVDDRLATYLGSARAIVRGVYNIALDVEGLVVRTNQSRKVILERMRHYNYGRRHLPLVLNNETIIDRYVTPVQETYRDVGRRETFVVIIGDNIRPCALPCFAKSRPIRETGNVILFPLNSERHLKPIHEVAAADVPWTEKIQGLVWRGSTTGRFHANFGAETLGSRYYVSEIEINDARIDIGYSHLVQITSKQVGQSVIDRVNSLLKNRMSLGSLLRYKFLLSLEGNDVSSGLKWMLRSNSCVLMPEPKYETWACESWLRPFVHYVPVHHDLSNLQEMFAWCCDNDALCEEIARNGAAFIAQFTDVETERKIRRDVVSFVCDRIRYQVDPALFGEGMQSQRLPA